MKVETLLTSSVNRRFISRSAALSHHHGGHCYWLKSSRECPLFITHAVLSYRVLSNNESATATAPTTTLLQTSEGNGI